MPSSIRRWLFLCTVAGIFVFAFCQFTELRVFSSSKPAERDPTFSYMPGNRFKWKDLPQQHPVTSMRALPTGRPVDIPKIQYDFSLQTESAEAKAVREGRRNAVMKTFLHTWDGYREHAWLEDELKPVSGESMDSFGGWAATLVDSLDTLYIMGLQKEFTSAVNALAKVDFSRSTMDKISVFETTIRYLGGFLAAYDLSDNSLLLDKAVQLGDMLYVAFDTPNRMPVPWWNWKE